MKYLLLFSMARSGSTTLCNALNDLNGRFIDEPFHPEKHDELFGSSNLRRKLEETGKIREVLFEIQNYCDGFKELYGVSDPLTINYNRSIISNALKVIFLERKNVLKATISLKMAYYNDIWQGFGNKKQTISNITFDLKNVKKRYNQLKSFFEFKEKIKKEEFLDYIEVSYKDLYFNDTSKELDKIIDHFNLDVSNEKVKNVKDKWIHNKNKLNNMETYKKVSNSDEINNELGSEEFGFLY